MEQIKVLGVAHEQDLGALKSVLDKEQINCISAISTDENLIANIVSLPFDGVVAYIPKMDGLDFRFMERLYMSRKDITTVLIYDEIDPAIYENAMYCGITRVISADSPPDDICREVIKEISRSASRKEQALIRRYESRVVSVYSAKGGAGKTTSAVNIAACLAREKKVVLLDLDLQFGDAATYMGVDRIDTRTIAELCDEPNITPNTVKSYILKSEYGPDIIPSPATPERSASTTSDKLETIVSMLRSDYDFVIIDLPSVLDGNTLSMINISDTVYYIVNPEAPAMRDARSCFDVMTKYDIKDKVKLLLTKSGTSFINESDVKATLNMDIAASVPSDTKAAVESANMGIPAVCTKSLSRLSDGYIAFAEREFGIKLDRKAAKGLLPGIGRNRQR